MSIDVQQASVKPLEAAADLVSGELPSVHFQKVPCGRECVADSGEIGLVSAQPALLAKSASAARRV